LFYDPAYYLANPLKILAIWEGGLASHGGNLGVLIALYLYQRKTSDSYLWLVDRVSVAAALGSSFVRIGNFFNSEILGIPTQRAWGVVFARVDQLPRHPVQLYEALCYALVFVLLIIVYKKTYDKPIKGLLFGIFTALVFSIRFVLEFFKTEQAAYSIDLPISTGQMLSIPFALAGIGLIVWSLKNDAKQ
jgi:prolipoprotein diacylglyceryl transferase